MLSTTVLFISLILNSQIFNLQRKYKVEEFVQCPSFGRSSINAFDDDEDGCQSVKIVDQRHLPVEGRTDAHNTDAGACD